MDVNLFNKRIRNAINSASLSCWASTQDKKAYCRELLGNVDEHEVIINILSEVVEDILEDKAEDKFATFRMGDGVSILGNGKSKPATVIEANEDFVTVQADTIDENGCFSANRNSEKLIFQRSHDQVYIHLEGIILCRLKLGRRLEDYSTNRISESLNHLVSATQPN